MCLGKIARTINVVAKKRFDVEIGTSDLNVPLGFESKKTNPAWTVR